MEPLSKFDWILAAGWLARQCAEHCGCWDDEGTHPCRLEDGGEGESDCAACWLRKAAREAAREVMSDE